MYDRRTQIVVFVVTFVGYAFYILCRKSVSFVIPNILSDKSVTTEDVGLIISAQHLAYGISKFALGILSDEISARYLFSMGLFASSISVVGFAHVSRTYLYVFLWFANGSAQGCGWPACAKLLRFWFRPEQFGTVWSVLSSSMNVTGGLVPILLPWLLLLTGSWRNFLISCGLISMIWSMVALFSIKDVPQIPKNKDKDLANVQTSGTTTAGWKSRLNLLRSPIVWLLSLYYLVVMAARTCCENWAVLFLVDEKNVSLDSARSFLTAFEAGGFVSSLLTGSLTDFALANSSQFSVAGNPRMLVALLYSVGAAFSIQFIMWSRSLLALWAFCLGGFLYGNINIFGIVATESAPIELSGSSHAIVALAANVGAVLAGYPLSILAAHFNWAVVFYLLEALVTLSAVLMLATNRWFDATYLEKKKQ